MFGKKTEKAIPVTPAGDNMSKQVDTLIGAGTTIAGDLEFTGGLHIDGSVKGTVKATESNASLTLSQQGRLEGEVHAPHIVLDGVVEGDLYAAEKLELAGNARIHGNVYYNLIEIAVGAEVNGQLIRQTGDAEPLVTYSEED
ncbi:MAG: bactofilin family protein [bacterium]